MEYCLETHVLCKEYGRFKALDNLTIHVPKGSIYGFVGKNVPRYEQKTLPII